MKISEILAEIEIEIVIGVTGIVTDTEGQIVTEATTATEYEIGIATTDEAET